ncbi:hypothetical protein SKDZ_16G4100 [Saccharomyces kudriavzevii ZP591]|nr:hypothetical protein SKDZ_16G4100 [Saccharomyces kudriavzevii ZP591]
MEISFMRYAGFLPPLFCSEQHKIVNNTKSNLMAATCICQPNLLEINVSDGPLNMIRKRRKIQQSLSGSFLRENKRQPQFSLRKINHCYILSFYREITCQLITEILQKKISRLWGKLYIPSYELISDNRGNQIYVEQGVEEDKLVSEIMKRVNPSLIDLEATQTLFDDYHLELSRLGDSISVSSSRDCFHKEFSFNSITDGKFKIRGTSVSADGFGKIYGVMWVEIPFINENSLHNDCSMSKFSAFHGQIENPDDIEQEIRAFNISRNKQERIIKREVSRRFKEQEELYGHQEVIQGQTLEDRLEN